MGQQQGVFDPASGKVVTLEEAQALVKGGGAPKMQGLGAGDSGPVQSNAPMTLFNAPGDMPDVALNLPPMEPEMAQQIMAAVPQVAGMVATMHPALRGVKSAMLIPAVTRALVDVVVNGGELDMNRMAEDALMGLAGHGVGKGISAVGSAGRSMVQRSLDLGGSGYLNTTAEQVLPNAAIREDAHMTPEFVKALRDKFKSTGAAVYEDLANVLESAGLKSRNSPNFNGGGMLSLIGNKLFPPETQLEVGKNLAAPMGINLVPEAAGKMAGTSAPAMTAEQALRSALAYVQSQMAAPSTPQRKPLQ